MINGFLKWFTLLFLLVLLGACQSGDGREDTAVSPEQSLAENQIITYEELVVGYSQIGAESEWRTGNTTSIKSAAESLGVELIFSDGQQKQENQIKAIRTFIAQQLRCCVPPQNNAASDQLGPPAPHLARPGCARCDGGGRADACRPSKRRRARGSGSWSRCWPRNGPT